MQSAIAADNAFRGSLGYAIHPTIFFNLVTTVKDAGSGQFVAETNPNRVSGFGAGLSTAMTHTDATITRVLFGNWNELIVATWSRVDILINPFSNSQFRKGGLEIVAFLTFDVAVRHPESFALGSFG